MTLNLLAALLSIWLASGIALLGLCRCAARGDRTAHQAVERHQAVHWARLDR